MKVVTPWYNLAYIIPHMYVDLDAYQFYRVAPEGMMLTTTSLNLTEYDLASVEQEMATLWSRYDLLASRRVDRIALSGVPIASAMGRSRVLALLAEATARTGIACDTDIEAHIAVLKHFGATRIALATRWDDAVNGAMARYFAEAGIEVVACAARARTLAQNKAASPADDHALAVELGDEAMRMAPDAHALLLPGGLWFAVHAARLLEAKHGCPVLLNVLSTTWAALRHAGARMQVRPDPRWGRVMASLA